jgi:hypothetical protein
MMNWVIPPPHPQALFPAAAPTPAAAVVLSTQQLCPTAAAAAPPPLLPQTVTSQSANQLPAMAVEKDSTSSSPLPTLENTVALSSAVANNNVPEDESAAALLADRAEGTNPAEEPTSACGQTAHSLSQKCSSTQGNYLNSFGNFRIALNFLVFPFNFLKLI